MWLLFLLDQGHKYTPYVLAQSIIGTLSFTFYILQWNNLDPRIINLPSIDCFKRAILKFTRPSPASTFRVSKHQRIILLTRLRVGFSVTYVNINLGMGFWTLFILFVLAVSMLSKLQNTTYCNALIILTIVSFCLMTFAI